MVIFKHVFKIKPQAKQSVRYGGGKFFQDKKKIAYVAAIRNEARIRFNQCRTDQLLSLAIEYGFKHKTKTGYKPSRPDIDNLLKPVKDALSGVVYVDDSQIVSIIASKKFAKEDYIKITISIIKEDIC